MDFFDELNFTYQFSLVKIDKTKYLEVEGVSPYNPEYKHMIEKFYVDARIRQQDLDIQRRHKIPPAPRVDRLGFPTDSGYTRYSYESTGLFFRRLYELARAHGYEEPKLLINHAFEQPLYSRVFASDEYRANLQISKGYCSLFHAFLQDLISDADLDDCKVYAHKSTSIGPPFSRADGSFFEVDDISYGIETDVLGRQLSALRKDYLQVKRGWFDRFSNILERQVDLSNIGIANYTGDVIKLYLDCVLPTSVPGYRKNSIDKAIVTEKGVHTQVYTKDRAAGYFTKDGMVYGRIDNKRLTDDLVKITRNKTLLATNRSREITSISWPSQVPAAVHTKMLLGKFEKSVNGFASTSDASIQGYQAFIQACNNHAGEFIFLNGDRSNAETFVTTNYEQFRELIPTNWRKLYDLQNSTLMFSEHYYYVKGLPSGMARTTELNWYMGTHEALLTIAKMLRVSIEDVSVTYFESCRSNRPFFEIGSFLIKLFMTTDDIPLIIHGPIERLDVAYLSSQEVQARKMEWNLSSKGMVTFGMEFTPTELKAAQVSVIAKLFYSEMPGFYVKDCFSLISKLQLLPPDLRRDISKLYCDFYNVQLANIEKASAAFLSWLATMGVPIDAFVNLYSPSSMVMYGELVNDDPILESSRVPSPFLEDCYKFYKSI